jgi:HEAT repeat protein
VIEQLASPDQGVRQRACEILAEIGTELSSKAIRKLPADPIPWVRDAAKNALRSIQNRKKLSGQPEEKDSDSPKAAKPKVNDI